MLIVFPFTNLLPDKSALGSSIARLTGGTDEILAQLNPAGADPAPYPRRASIHHRIRRHIAGDHASGTDETVLTQGNPAHDSGVGADGRSFFYQGSLILVLSLHKGPWVDHVGKYAGRTAEYIVLDRKSVV